MLFAILATLAILALLDQAVRGQRLETIKLEKSYQLFALRDQLRRALIEDQVKPGNAFECLDTTLTRLIGSIDRVNLWDSIALTLEHAGDRELLQAFDNFQRELQRPGNERLQEIFSVYMNTIIDLLYHRHQVLIRSVGFTDRIYRWTQAAKDQFVKAVMISPETSTVAEYCR